MSISSQSRHVVQQCELKIEGISNRTVAEIPKNHTHFFSKFQLIVLIWNFRGRKKPIPKKNFIKSRKSPVQTNNLPSEIKKRLLQSCCKLKFVQMFWFQNCFLEEWDRNKMWNRPWVFIILQTTMSKVVQKKINRKSIIHESIFRQYTSKIRHNCGNSFF